MTALSRFVPLVVAAVLLPASAADPVKPPEPPTTLMVSPGKLLVSDDLSGPLGKEWKAAKGKWEMSDGAVRASELPADMHGAVARRSLDMKDVVVAYSFKVDGAKVTTLSFNDAKGHVCRVLVRPTGLTVQKDAHDKTTEKPEQLGTSEVSLKPGQWHTLVVELRGPDILATLDGKHTAFGSHAGINLPKTNFGLTVAGESVSFKKLTVWDSAGVVKDWETTRAKLLAAKKAKG
jgi:hypothetical protein